MAKDKKTTVTKKAPAKPVALSKQTIEATPHQAVTKKTAVSKAPAAKKVVAKKAPVAKKVIAKKTIVKKAVAKKTVAKKTAAAPAAAPRTPPVKAPAPTQAPKRPSAPETSSSVTAEERDTMIRNAAYFLAEKRHFAPGFEADDWAEAERNVDEELSRRSQGRHA